MNSFKEEVNNIRKIMIEGEGLGIWGFSCLEIKVNYIGN